MGVKAQVETFHTADSTSQDLFIDGNWKQLILEGNKFIANGIDFPALRLRMGYAQYLRGNYSAALKQYDKVLHDDSYNQKARYYTYLCHKYLNQDLLANSQASYFDTTNTQQTNIGHFALLSAGLESSYKIADNDKRGNASYTRFSLNTQLSRRLQLDQSVSYFGQYIYTREIPEIKNELRENKDRQTEYFAKLSYALNNRIVLIGAYHYLYTNYDNNIYHSNVFLAGVNYAGTYFNAQGDVNIGHIIKDHVTQYNAKLGLYPLGNLNLYFISRGSYLRQNSVDVMIFNQIAGFKAIKNVWLESSATFGKLSNYIDADGLYIYNAFDDSKLKLGETLYYQINIHAMLNFSYTYEKKQNTLQALNYNQHSITAGILWKF
jgi:hypothetical protein